VLYVLLCLYPNSNKYVFQHNPSQRKTQPFCFKKPPSFDIYYYYLQKRKNPTWEIYFSLLLHHYHNQSRHKKIINKNAERCQTRSTRQGEPSPSVPRAYVKPPVPFFVFFFKKTSQRTFWLSTSQTLWNIQVIYLRASPTNVLKNVRHFLSGSLFLRQKKKNKFLFLRVKRLSFTHFNPVLR